MNAANVYGYALSAISLKEMRLPSVAAHCRVCDTRAPSRPVPPAGSESQGERALHDSPKSLAPRPRSLSPASRSPQDDIPLCPHGIPNADEITAALRSISHPLSGQRRDVQPDGVPEIEAMCLGMSWDYSRQRAAYSLPSEERPNSTAFFDRLCRYTSIQLSRGYSAAMHTDSNNAESPYIIGLGDYSGDELWAMDDQGEQGFEVTRKIPGYRFKEGDVVPGRLHNIHNSWLAFDDLVPHAANSFKEERMRLVYFTRVPTKRRPSAQPGC